MTFLKYKEFVINESRTPFQNSFHLDLEWWSVWKDKYEDKFEYELDTLTKSYYVYNKDDNKLVFIYDYHRSLVFTNKRPNFFNLDGLDNINPDEYKKIQQGELGNIEGGDDNSDNSDDIDLGDIDIDDDIKGNDNDDNIDDKKDLDDKNNKNKSKKKNINKEEE